MVDVIITFTIINITFETLIKRSWRKVSGMLMMTLLICYHGFLSDTKYFSLDLRCFVSWPFLAPWQNASFSQIKENLWNILALLSIVFVPNTNRYVPTGQLIYIFPFRANLYAFFSCGFIFYLLVIFFSQTHKQIKSCDVCSTVPV